MEISLNWLKDYVDFKVSSEELAHRLTMAGLEVKKISSLGDDTVFELEITPNRPDCLNMLGLARETAAILKKSYKFPALKNINFPKLKAEITIEDKKACPCYIGTVIENVSVASAPEKIKKRLESLGARGINNIVDITNFCLMETGQPLHAFDCDKLIGGKIIVRRARKGEKIVTIDCIERVLDENILVIADEQRPVAIAGVMGGKNTEVTGQTKNILLESAYFDPILIRRAARQLGLSSDSSYRFERGVDFSGVEKGACRAISLILEHAQGQITKRTKISSVKEKPRTKIKISKEEIAAYLGEYLTLAQCKATLLKLDFKVVAKGKNSLEVSVPSFRADVKQAVDLIEEIARISGYEQTPLTVPQIKISNISSSPERKLKNTLRQILLAQGLNEVITTTMINQKALVKSKLESSRGIKIQNPLTQEQEILRPSILPSLLSIASLNFNRGQKDFAFFELGKIYLPGQAPSAAGQAEKDVLGIVMSGACPLDWRRAKREEFDFYDLKGVFESIFLRLDIRELNYSDNESTCFEQGQRASVFVKGKGIGSLGKISDEVLKNWDIKSGHVFFAEIDIQSFLSDGAPLKTFFPLQEFPAVVRDVSVAVKDSVRFADIKKLAVELGRPILKSVIFKEEYRGEKIPAGQRGLVFSLVYQSPERTLTEEDVIPIHEKILQSFKESLGAVIR